MTTNVRPAGQLTAAQQTVIVRRLLAVISGSVRGLLRIAGAAFILAVRLAAGAARG